METVISCALMTCHKFKFMFVVCNPQISAQIGHISKDLPLAAALVRMRGENFLKNCMLDQQELRKEIKGRARAGIYTGLGLKM